MGGGTVAVTEWVVGGERGVGEMVKPKEVVPDYKAWKWLAITVKPGERKPIQHERMKMLSVSLTTLHNQLLSKILTQNQKGKIYPVETFW